MSIRRSNSKAASAAWAGISPKAKKQAPVDAAQVKESARENPWARIMRKLNQANTATEVPESRSPTAP
jgi:hypothetical protein